MTKIFWFFLIITMFSTSCASRVNPNEWVVSTTNCWNNFTVSKAGSVIPRLVTNCDRMIILPATQLGAEFVCETKFAQRVAGEFSVTYQWRISDPVTFIQSAKNITSASTGSDSKIDPDALEAVENAVVDKMLIDIIREYTPTKEAGIDEKVVEEDLAAICQKKFQNRGVEFSNMSININFSPQTEEALDVISSLKFYEANGELEFGREVIRAKASAPRIEVISK